MKLAIVAGEINVHMIEGGPFLADFQGAGAGNNRAAGGTADSVFRHLK
ncbi:MAG: hypothetical protein WBD25_19960 [Terriglobales bacterium]